jgi:beta-lactamase class A
MHAPQLAAMLALAAAPSLAPAQTPAADSLRRSLEQRIAAEPGAAVAVWFRDLARPESLGVNADARFHAASTMKVAVMIQVFRDADAGRLNLRARLPVTNAFRSLADGSTFSLDAADDSDPGLYRQIGSAVRIEELVHRMITRSSNLATNLLVERVGADRIQAAMNGIGADSLRVLRGVEDGPAFRAGLNNTTTARGLGTALAAIANGEAADASSCGRMLEILSDTEDRDAIPRGLPRRTRFAHKTGEITAVRHDAGVVYIRGRPRYVIVVLTSGIREMAVANRLIADLAALIHAHAAR